MTLYVTEHDIVIAAITNGNEHGNAPLPALLDEVVACGGYDQNGGIASLAWGMVECGHHGESIGKALLLHRLTCIEKEYGNITVEIDTSQLTQGFYEKFGLTLTKVEKVGYKPGLDKVYMACKVHTQT